MITIFIPTPLRRFTAERSSVTVQAINVVDALRSLIDDHPSLGPYIYDDASQIRRHVRLYLGEEDIREKEGLQTELKDGDVISIIPAIAGGSNL
jgi:molybdopterin converting factor small subunit